jgi:hypothetical protein
MQLPDYLLDYLDDLERAYELTGSKARYFCDFGHYGCIIYVRKGLDGRLFNVHVRELNRMEVLH